MATSHFFVARDAPQHSMSRHAYVCPADYLKFVTTAGEIVGVEVKASSVPLSLRFVLTVNEGMPQGMIGIERSDREALDLQPFSQATALWSPAREVVTVTKFVTSL